MEQIVSEENLRSAFKKVKSNKGAAGVDKLNMEQTQKYFEEHSERLIGKLLRGTYHPKPTRRVGIKKPEGGERKLGIPTILDRVFQQAIAQVISPLFEEDFSEYSYGFRPGKSAHQAIRQAKQYVEQGYTTVVDIDLENFFDRVNHDKLMNLVAKKIQDKLVLHLIGRYLRAGTIEDNTFNPGKEGTPQGSPLSPLLSNILLNELDKELTKRGHRFCRYADDCNIYVKTQKAGERVMKSITEFLEKKLKLKVNELKSRVSPVTEVKFLGFSFWKGKDGGYKIIVHKKALRKFKDKVKQITRASSGSSAQRRIAELNPLLRGWGNYFKLVEFPKYMKDLDGWIRRRLRMCYWKDWKQARTRFRYLRKLGASVKDAAIGYSRNKSWRMSRNPVIHRTLNDKHFENLGYISLDSIYAKAQLG